MTTPFGFDDLRAILHRRIAQLPDHRTTGPNTRYRIQDAALAPWSLFLPIRRQFLDYQRHLQEAKGRNNACTLFGMETIPCNNQIRNLLDP